MNIILLGAPGVGKGTQADKLQKLSSLRIIKLSTGDLLRKASSDQKTSIGKQINKIIANGGLVSDNILYSLVNAKINEANKADYGIVFDGFPRNLKQAKFIKERKINIAYVIFINVNDELIVNRLSGRRIHLSSGRIYHLDYSPSKTPGIDDISGEILNRRNDDEESTVRKRLKIYRENTRPLIQWYKNQENIHFFTVDGSKSVEEVHQQIVNNLGYNLK